MRILELIPYENNENNENHIISYANHKNKTNFRIPFDNKENHENLKKIHERIMKIINKS